MLEVRREHPHAERQRGGGIDQHEDEQVVVEPQGVDHVIEGDEQDGLRDDVAREDHPPPPPEAGRAETPEGVGGGDGGSQGEDDRSREDDDGVLQPHEERVGSAEHVPDERSRLPLRDEQLLEVLQGRVQDDERVAEHVLLRGLQRLDEHEVDREEAVHDHEQHQRLAPEPPSPAPRAHAGSRSGGSKSRKSNSSAARRKGTSIRDRAEAGPNSPPSMASQ